MSFTPPRFVQMRNLTKARGANNSGIAVVIETGTGRTAIRKEIAPVRQEYDNAEREVATMRQLAGHPNIVQLYDFIPADRNPPATHHQLFMEYCKVPISQGRELNTLYHLRQFYQVRRADLPEAFVWHLFEGLLKAVCFMQHGVRYAGDSLDPDWIPIAHGDLHEANIFLSSKGPKAKVEYPRIVVGDFGCAQANTHGMDMDFVSKLLHSFCHATGSGRECTWGRDDVKELGTLGWRHSEELRGLVLRFKKIRDGSHDLISLLQDVSLMKEELIQSGKLKYVPLIVE